MKTIDIWAPDKEFVEPLKGVKQLQTLMPDKKKDFRRLHLQMLSLPPKLQESIHRLCIIILSMRNAS